MRKLILFEHKTSPVTFGIWVSMAAFIVYQVLPNAGYDCILTFDISFSHLNSLLGLSQFWKTVMP